LSKKFTRKSSFDWNQISINTDHFKQINQINQHCLDRSNVSIKSIKTSVGNIDRFDCIGSALCLIVIIVFFLIVSVFIQYPTIKNYGERMREDWIALSLASRQSQKKVVVKCEFYLNHIIIET
jgi:hypothetical protein